VNPDLDLTLDRVIKAPPATVWKGLDRPGRLLPLVAARAVPVPRRAARRAARGRVGDEHERGRFGLRPAALVRHGDPEARARHEELGFEDGWGTVAAQLAAVAEGA
jgi:uncharacterized protein YndB with AHSA1/START domain